MSTVTVTNVRQTETGVPGRSADVFEVDLRLADGRLFPAALAVALSARHARIAGGSAAWCELGPPEVPFEALEGAESAALSAVAAAAGVKLYVREQQ
jgi:hypothetical protein